LGSGARALIGQIRVLKLKRIYFG